MGFFDSLKSLFGGGSSVGEQSQGVYWIYVRCRKCGEAIRTRVDLLNNLSQNDEGGYTVSKTLVGNRLCFERIEVVLTFDENRRLLSRDISRGDFITAEEFEAAQSEK